MKLFRNITPEYVDERGGITMILDENVPIQSVLWITCKKGSVRANHYHKKDTHYSYMVSGSMEYFEKPVGTADNVKPEMVIVKTGDIVFTPSMHMHAMKFLEDSVFIAFATESRHQADYESDTVRVKLI